MKFKAVIFDLDGTLINSLEDIADSMNTVLKTNKYPTHNYEAYNYFIGSGTRAKALPKNHSTENEIDYADLMTVYSNNCSIKQNRMIISLRSWTPC
jgi:phosphoglycolate phosphatase